MGKGKLKNFVKSVGRALGNTGLLIADSVGTAVGKADWVKESKYMGDNQERWNNSARVGSKVVKGAAVVGGTILGVGLAKKAAPKVADKIAKLGTKGVTSIEKGNDWYFGEKSDGLGGFDGAKDIMGEDSLSSMSDIYEGFMAQQEGASWGDFIKDWAQTDGKDALKDAIGKLGDKAYDNLTPEQKAKIEAEAKKASQSYFKTWLMDSPVRWIGIGVVLPFALILLIYKAVKK